MLVEQRTYILKGDYTPAMYFEAYRATGAQELQARVLGRLLGYFVTEIGELNGLVHLWGYDSFEERARRRALLAQEPAWHDYLAQIRPMLQSMSNRLLVPTDFSPIR
ncbi:NIPSNAP family protein [Xenophilus arseniciresistens]|jgi:hypothetical protein|uniref:NIPSNAP family protein n=1 Tax=Xenophilus arseniciresistens TaxID=1283306 RepID=A0AAE3NE48_9BURK|nr:NIPSNAP family protein [Xenophilus arseniciresistens]MDA7419186.1 NIPSNAP family protein [Xenophilus arseniciresistens]